LFGDFEIVLDDDVLVTIGEVLDNPNKYHGRKTLDPIEGKDYDNGRVVGWINVRSGGRPYILSYAHGGRRYQLVRARKTINLAVGERDGIFKKTMELLSIDGAIYDRGGVLTRIIGSQTELVSPDWLLLHLDRTVRFESYRVKKEGEVVVVPHDAPEWLSRRTVKAVGEWGLPQLTAVVDATTIDLRTGRIIAEDGYDSASGLFMQLTGDVAPVPENAAPADVEEALKTLWRPFELFPFSDTKGGRISRGGFLAVLLTAVCRRLLTTAPGFLIDAPIAGTGKTLLALCAAVLASGDYPDVLGVAEGVSEEEVKKVLFAKAMKASPTVFIDNVAGMFKSAAVCAFLTSPFYEDRILGLSRTATAPTNSLFLMTGNHPVIVGDLNRRLIRCELDPQMESPHKRAFKLDPLDYCREHRLEMIRAALIVLKAWHNAGRPNFTPDRTASFEMWSDTVRQAVIWVGRNEWLDVADPVESIDAGFEADPETRKLDALLRAWEAEFGDRRRPVKDVRPYADDQGSELFDALDEIGVIERGVLNTKRLGRWIERHAGRVVEGRRFVRVGLISGNMTWRVERP